MFALASCIQDRVSRCQIPFQISVYVVNNGLFVIFMVSMEWFQVFKSRRFFQIAFKGWVGSSANMLILDGFPVTVGFGEGFRDGWVYVKRGSKFFPPCAPVFWSRRCSLGSNMLIYSFQSRFRVPTIQFCENWTNTIGDCDLRSSRIRRRYCVEK